MSEALRNADAEARRIAQREHQRPLVLEAGAGTGKTSTLVARVCAWVLGEGWRRAEAQGSEPRSAAHIASTALRRIVAITFTEAAAAEMATRVGEALACIEGGELPIGLDPDALPAPVEAMAPRARALLGALDHLEVATIHAFCRSLLATYPLEAGLHPHLQVDADGEALDSILVEVAEPMIRARFADAQPHALLSLAELGIGPEAIIDAVTQLATSALPAAQLQRSAFSPERVQALFQRLQRETTALREIIAEPLSEGRRIKAHKLLDSLAALEGALLLEGPRDLDALRSLIETRLQEMAADFGKLLSEWGRGRFTGKAERAALEPQVESLAPCAAAFKGILDHMVQLDPTRLELARQVVAELLAAVQREMRARGVLSFGALLREAARLLREVPEVRRRVRSEIDQLLVDEFQDTDPLQCELVGLIALDPKAPPAQRPGLFIVGDPKQSIYGWRSADLRAYEDFVGRVLEAGGAQYRLSVNYRSVPSILDEVERICRPVMRAKSGVQPRFQPLVPAPQHLDRPGFDHAPRAAVEHWVSWEATPEGEVALHRNRLRTAISTRLEADALARDIRELHDSEGVAWREFAVLLRSTTDLELYLAALRQLQIPFAVEKDKSYFRRREIIDASAAVRCVLDPNDQLALLTLLRSPSVGVPDAALIPLFAGDLPAQVAALHGHDPKRLAQLDETLRAALAQLPADVPGLERVRGWDDNLRHALAWLGRLRESFRSEAADRFVEALRAGLMLEATEAARYLGAFRAANLERFFRQLTETLVDAHGDPQVALRGLRRSVADAREAEEGRPHEAAQDAVQIMTIHKAKGLDFRHVYVMQIHKGSGRGYAGNVELGEMADGGLEYRLFGAPTPGWDLAAAHRTEVEAAERVRTLYVAATRAKDRLVLSGAWLTPQGLEAPPPPELAPSYAALLAHREGARPALPERMPQLFAEGASDELGADGERWYYPGIWQGNPPVPAEDAEAEVAPDPEEVAAKSRALLRAREAAAQRMLRSYSAAPSSRAHAHMGDEAEPKGSEAPGFAGEDADEAREVAMAAGTAVHALLEEIDLHAERSAELARLAQSVTRHLRPQLPPALLDRGVAKAEEILDRLVQNPILDRLYAIRDHIVARELPVILPAGEADEAVGYLSGAIDLVYRDPHSGEIVVADYKTDRPGDEAAIAERCASYALQGEVYVRALQDALALDYLPRFELWFLAADTSEPLRVVPVGSAR